MVTGGAMGRRSAANRPDYLDALKMGEWWAGGGGLSQTQSYVYLIPH